MTAAIELPISSAIDGKYALLRPLGTGAAGIVYEAEHLIVGKRVAIKLLHPHLAADHRIRSRFVAEARAAARIGHPNVVDIHDLGVSREGAVYMVMELLTGETLEQILEERGALSAGYACELMLQVLSGLCAAHAQGIVHRDLKPANVVVTHPRPDRPHVKVLDFGIAKGLLSTLDSSGQGSDETVLGTPLYMAPEQALGRDVDQRTDVWAVGAMLFELLSGIPPIAGTTTTQVLSRVVTGEVLHLHAIAPHVPPALAAAVQRALSPDPAERPQSAAELAALLTPFVIGRSLLPIMAASLVPFPLVSGVALRTTSHAVAPDSSALLQFDPRRDGPRWLGVEEPEYESAILLRIPPSPVIPNNWGVRVSSVPSSLPAPQCPPPTRSELARRRALTEPVSRAKSLAHDVGMRAALFATLTGFGAGIALAWMGGLF